MNNTQNSWMIPSFSDQSYNATGLQQQQQQQPMTPQQQQQYFQEQLFLHNMSLAAAAAANQQMQMQMSSPQSSSTPALNFYQNGMFTPNNNNNNCSTTINSNSTNNNNNMTNNSNAQSNMNTSNTSNNALNSSPTHPQQQQQQQQSGNTNRIHQKMKKQYSLADDRVISGGSSSNSFPLNDDEHQQLQSLAALYNNTNNNPRSEDTSSYSMDLLEHLDLSKFKIESCPNMSMQHNHKQCQYYHGLKDRRRVGVSYSSDGCNFIEQFGSGCPSGDECSKSHNKVEQLYRPDKYKTKFCTQYPNNCKACEYGVFCSFAHSEADINIELIHNYTYDVDFYVFFYKTVWCPFNYINHDRGMCVYAHNWQDYRRRPNQANSAHYHPEPCQSWDPNSFITDYEIGCPNSTTCTLCHGWKELEYHPNIYRTKPCQTAQPCPKSKACPYYHNQSEKRNPSSNINSELFKYAPRNRILKGLFKQQQQWVPREIKFPCSTSTSSSSSQHQNSLHSQPNSNYGSVTHGWVQSAQQQQQQQQSQQHLQHTPQSQGKNANYSNSQSSHMKNNSNSSNASNSQMIGSISSSASYKKQNSLNSKKSRAFVKMNTCNDLSYQPEEPNAIGTGPHNIQSSGAAQYSNMVSQHQQQQQHQHQQQLQQSSQQFSNSTTYQNNGPPMRKAGTMPSATRSEFPKEDTNLKWYMNSSPPLKNSIINNNCSSPQQLISEMMNNNNNNNNSNDPPKRKSADNPDEDDDFQQISAMIDNIL